MAILVSDTSVLIDLERGGLIEHAFTFGMTLVVPDLLYQAELEEENGPYLKTLGLGIVSLTSAELKIAQGLRNSRPALSLPDCFALTCALRQNHVLLTGDAKLKNEAKAQNVQAFGVLWILDQMEQSGCFSKHQLHEGLSRLAAHQTCRLPPHEVNARLAKWL